MMDINLEANIDYSKITGLTELLTAVDKFITRVDNGEIRSVTTYGEFKAAMNKIGGNVDDCLVAVTVENKAPFYHMNGTPASYDIEEEVGQMILACSQAMDFIHNGPLIGASQQIIDEMYEAKVSKVIPKLQSLIENRITVKFPYSKLVDDSFFARNDLNGAKMNSVDKLRCSADRLTEEAEQLAQEVEMYEPVRDPIPATAIISQLAMMTAHMQQIMVLFGWTWDDVKLVSRQQISELETKD